MDMSSGKQPESGPFARAISEEVRAHMARPRISASQLAKMSGLSRNYLGKRLRDETSFTANDIEAICKALNVDLLSFIESAVRNLRPGG